MTSALLLTLQYIAIAHAAPRKKDVGHEQPVELLYPSAPSHAVASALYPVEGRWVYLTIAASKKRVDPSSALPRDVGVVHDLSECASKVQAQPFFVAYYEDASWKAPDSASPTTKCLAGNFLNTHVQLRGAGWSTLSRFEAHPESIELSSDVKGVAVLRDAGAVPASAVVVPPRQADVNSETMHHAMHAPTTGTPCPGSTGMVEGFVDFLSLQVRATRSPGDDGWMSAISQLNRVLGPQLLIHASCCPTRPQWSEWPPTSARLSDPTRSPLLGNYYLLALQRQGRPPDVAFAGSDPWTVLMQLSQYAPADYAATGGAAAILLGAN